MAVQVRRVTPEEYRDAGEVTALAYRELASDASPNPDYLDRIADVGTRARHALVLGAFEDGRILGTVTLEVRDRIPGGHTRPPLAGDQAHVRMLGVRPDAQRRGIARTLMERCIEEARRTGKRRVTLETTEWMRAAHRLYESMGFVRRDDLVFDDGFHLRRYELEL